MKKAVALLVLLVFTFIVNAQSVYKVRFTSGVTQYYGALVLFDSGTGKMRTKYYSESCKCTRTVEQTMNVEKTTAGLRITGYNPVYPGTNTKFPSYSADNFYIARDYTGKLSITNIDDQGDIASASIELITSSSTKRNFLSEFNWQLK